MLTIVTTFSPSHVRGSEEIVLTRYGYGFKWDGIRHNTPSIWPFPYLADARHINDVIYLNFRTSDSENKSTQAKRQFYVHLSLHQKNKYLQATVSFQNKSNKSYFVHRKGLIVLHDPYFYPLCSDVFSITTDGIILHFLKSACIYFIEDENKHWKEIPAGKNYSFTVNLNEAYAFPYGNRRYNIGSKEYDVVTKEWFHELNIFTLMFSILEWRISCRVNKNISHIERLINDCEQEETSFKYHLERIGIRRENSNNQFNIRTNQVIIYINGEELKHSYDNQY